MKRIGILSDTHGYLEDIDLVLEATADQDIDMWLHAGDFGDDARYIRIFLCMQCVVITTVYNLLSLENSWFP